MTCSSGRVFEVDVHFENDAPVRVEDQYDICRLDLNTLGRKNPLDVMKAWDFKNRVIAHGLQRSRAFERSFDDALRELRDAPIVTYESVGARFEHSLDGTPVPDYLKGYRTMHEYLTRQVAIRVYSSKLALSRCR